MKTLTLVPHFTVNLTAIPTVITHGKLTISRLFLGSQRETGKNFSYNNYNFILASVKLKVKKRGKMFCFTFFKITIFLCN